MSLTVNIIPSDTTRRLNYSESEQIACELIVHGGSGDYWGSLVMTAENLISIKNIDNHIYVYAKPYSTDGYSTTFYYKITDITTGETYIDKGIRIVVTSKPVEQSTSKVNFYSGVGGASVQQITQTGNNNITVPSANNTANIQGWTKKCYVPNGAGDDPNPNTVINFGSTINPGTIRDYYALYTRNLTLVFNKNANDATGTMNSIVKVDGYNSCYSENTSTHGASFDIPTLSNSFSRSGYTLKGWNTTQNDTVVFGINSSYSGSSLGFSDTVNGTQTTITLYACWEKNATTTDSQTIYFYSGLDCSAQSSKSWSGSGTITAPSLSSLSSYGWTTLGYVPMSNYDNPNPTFYVAGGGSFTPEEIRYYGLYTRNLTLNFNKNASNASGSINSLTVKDGYASFFGESTQTYNPSFIIPTSGFTRSGYKISSWNTEADGSGITVTPGESVSAGVLGFSIYPKNNSVRSVTLYAQWASTAATSSSITTVKFYSGLNKHTLITKKRSAGSTPIEAPTSIESEDIGYGWTIIGYLPWVGGPSGYLIDPTDSRLIRCGDSFIPTTNNYYAVYTKPYSIEYNKTSPDATGITPSTVVIAGTSSFYNGYIGFFPDEFVVSECYFTNSNLRFVGWNTAFNGYGEDLSPGDTISVEDYFDDDVYLDITSIVLYAMWKKVAYIWNEDTEEWEENESQSSYNINYELSGGFFPSEESHPTVQYYGVRFPDSQRIGIPKKNGYKFTSWNIIDMQEKNSNNVTINHERWDEFDSRYWPINTIYFTGTTATAINAKYFHHLAEKSGATVTFIANWEPQGSMYINTENGWKLAMPYIYDGTNWKMSIAYICTNPTASDGWKTLS